MHSFVFPPPLFRHHDPYETVLMDCTMSRMVKVGHLHLGLEPIATTRCCRHHLRQQDTKNISLKENFLKGDKFIYFNEGCHL